MMFNPENAPRKDIIKEYYNIKDKNRKLIEANRKMDSTLRLIKKVIEDHFKRTDEEFTPNLSIIKDFLHDSKQ